MQGLSKTVLKPVPGRDQVNLGSQPLGSGVSSQATAPPSVSFGGGFSVGTPPVPSPSAVNGPSGGMSATSNMSVPKFGSARTAPVGGSSVPSVATGSSVGTGSGANPGLLLDSSIGMGSGTTGTVNSGNPTATSRSDSVYTDYLRRLWGSTPNAVNGAFLAPRGSASSGGVPANPSKLETEVVNTLDLQKLVDKMADQPKDRLELERLIAVAPNKASNLISKALHKKVGLPNTEYNPLLNEKGHYDFYMSELLEKKGIKNMGQVRESLEFYHKLQEKRNKFGTEAPKQLLDMGKKDKTGKYLMTDFSLNELVDKNRAFLKYGTSLTSQQQHIKEKGLNPSTTGTLPAPLHPIAVFALEQGLAREMELLNLLFSSVEQILYSMAAAGMDKDLFAQYSQIIDKAEAGIKAEHYYVYGLLSKQAVWSDPKLIEVYQCSMEQMKALPLKQKGENDLDLRGRPGHYNILAPVELTGSNILAENFRQIESFYDKYRTRWHRKMHRSMWDIKSNYSFRKRSHPYNNQRNPFPPDQFSSAVSGPHINRTAPNTEKKH